MLLRLRQHFNGGQCYFLTFKSINAKHDINFVNKLCKQVSKTYAIVREKNKITDGYHYHAILKLAALPPKKWFKRGIHMNMKRIGLTPHSKHSFTKKDCHEMTTALTGAVTPQDVKDLMDYQEDDKILAAVERSASQLVYSVHVDRILNYMSKEMELPAQYADYVFSLRGKMTALEERCVPVYPS